MAEIQITLEQGLKVGEEWLKAVVLRELTTGDIIAAREESEKLMMTPDGPALVASPALEGINLLRRQILRIGNLAGPLDRNQIGRLSLEDLNLLQAKANELDEAALAEIASRAVTQRGRDHGADTSAGETDDEPEQGIRVERDGGRVPDPAAFVQTSET